jgi:predicted amidohydrolase YtcJ
VKSTEHFTAELILVNGKILTFDRNGTIAEAIAVQRGEIGQVGTTSEIEKLAGEHTKKINLMGKTLIPGFIDAHTHNDMYGMMTSDLVVDCHIPPLESVEDILEAIRKKAQTLPKGDLILGQGRPFQPYPTLKQLNGTAPQHPVIIKPSMHWYLLNAAALKRFNITRYRPTFEELFAVDPCGVIQRDLGTGEPTGYVEECWNYMFPRSRSPFNYNETCRVVKEGLDKHSRYGVTSLVEFADFPETPKIYRDLCNAGELPIRLQIVPCFYGLYQTVELDEVIHAGLTTGFGDEWIKFGGVKIFVDRQQDTTCSSIQLKEWFSRAHRAGLRVYMHAITRKGQGMALEAIEAEASQTGIEKIRAMRHRIEHMGNENHDITHLPRIQKLGAIALPTAYFLNMGPNKLLSPKTDKSFMFRTMLELGQCVPGNSDGGGAFPEAPNPMYQIWCMVTRKAFDGIPVCPSEKISLLEALKVYTLHSAYAGLEEKTKGSIEVGKLADFAVFAEDPLTSPEEHLRDIEIEMTIVGGKVVYQKGEK